MVALRRYGVEVPDEEGTVETALALSGSAAQSKIQTYPGDADFFERLTLAFAQSWPRPRVIVTSFPHNPTTKTVDLSFFERLVDFARENEVVVVDADHGDLFRNRDIDPPADVEYMLSAHVVAGKDAERSRKF